MMRTRRGARRRGLAAVELALAMSMLMLLVVGCVDLGRFAYYYIAVTNAARAGASYAIMNNYTTSTQATWNAAVVAAGQAETNISGVTIDTPPTVSNDANNLKRVRVVARYTFAPMIPWPGLPRPLNMARAVEMRLIR